MFIFINMHLLRRGALLRLSVLLRLGVLLSHLLLLGCSSTPKPHGEVEGESASAGEIVQSDINRVASLGLKSNLNGIGLMQDILYQYNPQQWQNGSETDLERAKATVWTAVYARGQLTPEIKARGTKAIELALQPDFQGDRVALYVYGLADILLEAHGGRSSLYLIHGLDAQKLYNAARQIELAAQDLHAASARKGRSPLSLPDQNKDVRMERVFGQIIAQLDVMADATTEKYRRIGINYFQGLIGGQLFQFIPVEAIPVP